MTVTANIPIIDLSAKVLEGDIARRLVDAAIEHGFIYIKNTGADISVEKVASAFDMVRSDLTHSFVAAVERLSRELGRPLLLDNTKRQS